MGPGEQLRRLTPAMAPLLASRDPALGPFQIQLGHTEEARVGDLTPIGQRGEALQAEINPRLLTSRRQVRTRHLGAGDRNVPAVRLPANRDRLGRPLDRTGPVHGQAPDLGQGQEAVIKPGAVAIFLEAEAVEAITALEPWK